MAIEVRLTAPNLRSLIAGLLLLAGGTTLAAQETPPSREMNALNWMDFEQWVPSRVQTVLLPVGTLEAHGVGNNGADNTVPEALARQLAPRINAFVAPTISYGYTTSLSAFPGTFGIPKDIFQDYCREVMRGLVKTGFENLIVLNGHGPNFQPLQEAATELSEETGVRTLVVNWWTMTADISRDVYGSDGGHAGANETGAILATTPGAVHPELYTPELAWWRLDGVAVYPFPGSIILYQEAKGYPDFDLEKAGAFWSRVVDRVETLIRDTTRRWGEMETHSSGR